MKKVMFMVLIIIGFMASSVYADSPCQDKFISGASTIIAGNYDVDTSTTTTSPAKKSDGGACSNNDECKSGTCEGGSCCTDSGDSCDSSSHCCGHPSQGCTDGKCP